MKKRNLIYKVFLISILLTPLCFGAWDKTKPAASTSLANSNPQILANFSALETALGQDHTFAAGTPDGKHVQITFTDPLSSAPSSVAASEGVLYLLDVSGKAELHFEDEDENTLQITSAGDLYSSTNLQVVGTTTLTGALTANDGITLGAGDDLIGSATSDITFNTDKFTVAGATGNTLVAGTLDVTGVMTTTAASVLGDGSLLATSGAPSTDAMIANKKYVDDQDTAQETIKAWVVFDGTDTNPITKGAGFNIDGTITKNGTGDYTISWDTDFANGNYALSGMALDKTSAVNTVVSVKNGTVPLAGSVNIVTKDSDGDEVDVAYVSVMAIGD